jgi:hypothetical protein
VFRSAYFMIHTGGPKLADVHRGEPTVCAQ